MNKALRNWEIAGLIALLVIVACIPIYYFRHTAVNLKKGGAATPMKPVFVGAKACADCHKPEYEKWRGSHHDLAMDVADDSTVLGDFNNREVTFKQTAFRFFKKEGRFYVNTKDADGRRADFQITHTLGSYPLQQYLIPFPKGRLQCLTIAWDVDKKQWYDLYPDQDIAEDDWLHWTGRAQNWNGMCAACHTTGYVKGYDTAKDAYRSSWAQIDVSCEACHGPGSAHVQWANMPAMARPELEDCGLITSTRGLSSPNFARLCARCHARRALLCDFTHPPGDLLDHLSLELLDEEIYFPDGQILEEDYVYGSFLQSKMYHRDVRCNDCHDVHSLKRVKKGNDLCLQCHRGQIYDTAGHHFHKQKGEKAEPILLADGRCVEVGQGALCENCHMPKRKYMGADWRLDHSIRVPRPDLSVEYGAPNACTACHRNKPVSWAAEYTKQWYGKKRKPHYGEVFARTRDMDDRAFAQLAQTAGDTLLPVIVRATALSLLARFPKPHSIAALERGLEDNASLIRQAALRALNRMTLSDDIRMKYAVPLLYDPVKGVRMEAAVCLSPVSAGRFKANQKQWFESALNDYIAAMTYRADFPRSCFNLAMLYSNLGQERKAEQYYGQALRIDGRFYPAMVNLAMLYNRQGKNEQAQTLLEKACDIMPGMHTLAYSLGLLLAEQNKFKEAVLYLQRAARGMPDHAGVHLNLGLVLEQMGRFEAAEPALVQALKKAPDNIRVLHALAVHFLRVEQIGKANAVAMKMMELNPEYTASTRIVEQIQRARSRR